VDLQINGYKGCDFNSQPLTVNDIQKVTKKLWEQGVTSFLPTVITNSDTTIEELVNTIGNAIYSDNLVRQSIPGIHLEGPFISSVDGPRGAHTKDYVKAPSWNLFQRWQDASKGMIKLVTLSPEWPESTEFISNCIKNNVFVSIGHTAATIEEIQHAIDAGASLSTHLGNGAHLMLPRHPNYIWEQLSNDNLSISLIADGFHLPLSFLKVAMQVKGSKAFLVSDAVYLCGLEAGTYETHIGGKVTLTQEGRLHTVENPDVLAGSAQMLSHGISHLVRSGLTPLSTAWDMGSTRPSKFLGIPSHLGLAIGAPADLVLFKWHENIVKVQETYKGGELVYKHVDYL